MTLGTVVGAFEGPAVGTVLGSSLGDDDGITVGLTLGSVVGAFEGLAVGSVLGSSLGSIEGKRSIEGKTLGVFLNKSAFL